MSVHQVTGSVELPPKFLRILKEDDQGVITVEEKLFFSFHVVGGEHPKYE